MKRILIGIVLLVLISGCAMTATQPVIPTGRVEIYKVGQFTLRIYDDPRELTEDIKRLGSSIFNHGFLPETVIIGHHDRKSLTIYSIKSVYVLMNGLKHILEPSWLQNIAPCDNRACLEDINIK